MGSNNDDDALKKILLRGQYVSMKENGVGGQPQTSSLIINDSDLFVQALSAVRGSDQAKLYCLQQISRHFDAFPQHAQQAVRTAIQLLWDGDSHIRLKATQALSGLCEKSEKYVAEIIDGLSEKLSATQTQDSSPDLSSLREALFQCVKFQTKEAISALLNSVEGENAALQDAVTGFLKEKIIPNLTVLSISSSDIQRMMMALVNGKASSSQSPAPTLPASSPTFAAPPMSVSPAPSSLSFPSPAPPSIFPSSSTLSTADVAKLLLSGEFQAGALMMAALRGMSAQFGGMNPAAHLGAQLAGGPLGGAAMSRAVPPEGVSHVSAGGSATGNALLGTAAAVGGCGANPSGVSGLLPSIPPLLQLNAHMGSSPFSPQGLNQAFSFSPFPTSSLPPIQQHPHTLSTSSAAPSCGSSTPRNRQIGGAGKGSEKGAGVGVPYGMSQCTSSPNNDSEGEGETKGGGREGEVVCSNSTSAGGGPSPSTSPPPEGPGTRAAAEGTPESKRKELNSNSAKHPYASGRQYHDVVPLPCGLSALVDERGSLNDKNGLPGHGDDFCESFHLSNNFAGNPAGGSAGLGNSPAGKRPPAEDDAAFFNVDSPPLTFSASSLDIHSITENIMDSILKTGREGGKGGEEVGRRNCLTDATAGALDDYLDGIAQSMDDFCDSGSMLSEPTLGVSNEQRRSQPTIAHGASGNGADEPQRATVESAWKEFFNMDELLLPDTANDVEMHESLDGAVDQSRSLPVSPTPPLPPPTPSLHGLSSHSFHTGCSYQTGSSFLAGLNVVASSSFGTSGSISAFNGPATPAVSQLPSKFSAPPLSLSTISSTSAASSVTFSASGGAGAPAGTSSGILSITLVPGPPSADGKPIFIAVPNTCAGDNNRSPNAFVANGQASASHGLAVNSSSSGASSPAAVSSSAVPVVTIPSAIPPPSLVTLPPSLSSPDVLPSPSSLPNSPLMPRTPRPSADAHAGLGSDLIGAPPPASCFGGGASADSRSDGKTGTKPAYSLSLFSLPSLPPLAPPASSSASSLHSSAKQPIVVASLNRAATPRNPNLLKLPNLFELLNNASAGSCPEQECKDSVTLKKTSGLLVPAGEPSKGQQPSKPFPGVSHLLPVPPLFPPTAPPSASNSPQGRMAPAVTAIPALVTGPAGGLNGPFPAPLNPAFGSRKTPTAAAGPPGLLIDVPPKKDGCFNPKLFTLEEGGSGLPSPSTPSPVQPYTPLKAQKRKFSGQGKVEDQDAFLTAALAKSGTPNVSIPSAPAPPGPGAEEDMSPTKKAKLDSATVSGGEKLADSAPCIPRLRAERLAGLKFPPLPPLVIPNAADEMDRCPMGTEGDPPTSVALLPLSARLKVFSSHSANNSVPKSFFPVSPAPTAAAKELPFPPAAPSPASATQSVMTKMPAPPVDAGTGTRQAGTPRGSPIVPEPVHLGAAATKPANSFPLLTIPPAFFQPPTAGAPHQGVSAPNKPPSALDSSPTGDGRPGPVYSGSNNTINKSINCNNYNSNGNNENAGQSAPIPAPAAANKCGLVVPSPGAGVFGPLPSPRFSGHVANKDNYSPVANNSTKPLLVPKQEAGSCCMMMPAGVVVGTCGASIASVGPGNKAQMPPTLSLTPIGPWPLPGAAAVARSELAPPSAGLSKLGAPGASNNVGSGPTVVNCNGSVNKDKTPGAAGMLVNPGLGNNVASPAGAPVQAGQPSLVVSEGVATLGSGNNSGSVLTSSRALTLSAGFAGSGVVQAHAEGSCSGSGDSAGECHGAGKNMRPKRGAAMDAQSVAARLRRERINNKLKSLKDMIPGATKLDTCAALQQTMEYVRFLEAQIQRLAEERARDFFPPSLPKPEGGTAREVEGPGETSVEQAATAVHGLVREAPCGMDAEGENAKEERVEAPHTLGGNELLLAAVKAEMEREGGMRELGGANEREEVDGSACAGFCDIEMLLEGEVREGEEVAGEGEREEGKPQQQGELSLLGGCFDFDDFDM